MLKREYVNLLGGSVVLNFYSIKELKDLLSLKESGEDISKYLSEVKRVNFREELYKKLEHKGIKLKNLDKAQLQVINFVSENYCPTYSQLDLSRFKSVTQLENCRKWFQYGTSINRVYRYVDVPFSEDVADYLKGFKYGDYEKYLKYGNSFYNYCRVSLKKEIDFLTYLHLSKVLGVNKSLVNLHLKGINERTVSADMYTSYFYERYKYLIDSLKCNTTLHMKIVLLECLEYIHEGDRKQIKRHIDTDSTLKNVVRTTSDLEHYICCLLNGFDYELYTSLNLNYEELKDILTISYELIEDKVSLKSKLLGFEEEVIK